MKKITTLIAALALTVFGWQANAQNFNAGACPTGIAIPDNTPVGVDIIIPVTGAGTSLGVDIILDQVNFHAIHTWQSDLTITLTSPNGVTVILSDGNGNGTDNYGTNCTTMTSFTMSALTNITVGTGDFAGLHIPEESLMNFNDASSPNANWTLNVSDGAGGDIGNVEFIELVFAAPPACPDPSALSAPIVLATSANLGWTENGTAATWDIEWGTTGFAPTGTPTIVGTTTNPHNLTLLTASTAYDFYVRADCGSVNGTSAWIGPFSFTTACAAITLPWSEDFDAAAATPMCWTQGAANGESWLFGTTGGHVGNAGTIGGTTTSGNNFAWIDDSTPDNTGTTLESPFVDVSSLTSPMLSFYLISNNEGFSNVNFSVDVWDGAAWSVGFFTSNANTFNGEWEQISVILSSLTITGPVQLRFIVDEPATGDFRDDVAIDDITFIEAPACPDPTVLTVANITTTSADLGWTENGTASTWDIESGITGFAPTGTPTVTGTTTNPHNLTLLTANTTYDFYVRADCGSVNGTSAWVGPFTFFTGHCIPAPSSVDGDGITNVTMGTINNTTVAEVGNYGDYSAMVTTAQQSATFAIDVTLETGFTYDLWAWVDWNNDLDFTDAGEEFFLGTSTGNNPTTFSGTITIPLAATLGNHKIRIGGADSGLGNTSPSDPCYTGSFGSFEDYTLNVIAPAADDLGIISIQSAPTGCGLGMETVTIQVKNFGASAQSGFDVVYSLNGTPVTPETTTGNVLSGDTLTHVFTALANMTTPAIYTIDAWSILAADGDNSNDTLNGWMTQHLASSLAFNDSVVIPDNNTVGLSSIICTNGLVNNMLDSCYTLSALVIDSLTHTFNGDLEIWLISPAGDTLEVSSDNGGTTDNYINVTFTDTASTNINGNNPVPGFYHTEELVGLAKFNGTNPNGAWTLLVKDDAGGDIGVLYDWHLEFTDYNFTVNLGTDTNLCSTENVTLNAGAGNYSYVWSTGESTQTIVVDTASLGGSGVYNVNVVVTDTMSGCASNDTIIVNYSVCSGLNEVKNNINLNVYPNPSNGVFTLNVNTTDVNELDIKVMNIQGQVVFVKNNFDNVSTINEQIDLSDNANGIYFITVTSDKGIVTSKIIVQ